MQSLVGFDGARAVNDGLIQHYVGGARTGWVDIDDVDAVAVLTLLPPGEHAGKTYRLVSDLKTDFDFAQTLRQVIGTPFRYEPRPA